MLNIVEVTTSIQIEGDIESEILAVQVRNAVTLVLGESVKRWTLPSQYQYSIVRVFDADGEYVCEA